jgi:hypothetical protein
MAVPKRSNSYKNKKIKKKMTLVKGLCKVNHNNVKVIVDGLTCIKLNVSRYCYICNVGNH